jgi:putative ABC transport system permease protein
MNPIARWLERRRVERELADEMSAHLEERIEQLMDEGLSQKEARIRARRQFGNLTLQKEKSREAWGWNGIEQLTQDVRFGCRVLAKTPAFTLTAIAVLALGIGMNTAMFSAVKAVLLSALPYPEPDRLVEVWQTNKVGRLMNVSWLDFKDWRDQNRSMEQLATYYGDQVSLSGDFTPRRIRIGVASTGFFESIGVQAGIGRTFSREEQRPGGMPTAVLGYDLSQTIFGARAQAIGKPVRLNGMAFTVIGIMPPGFDFPFRAQAWFPQELFPEISTRSAHNYHVIGRLRPRTPIRRAQEDMNVIAARLAKAYIDDRDEGIKVVPLYDEIVGPVRPAFLILLAAVTLVLLIACVNISSLHLARGTVRAKELGLRAALGAGRARLIRQLLTEAVLLAVAGGTAGLALAIAGTAILRHSAPANIPRLESIRVDMSILCFTAALSIGAGLLFGALAAIAGSHTDVNEALKQGSGKSTTGPQMKRWSNALVVGQIGLAVVLLSGATLLLKSYWKLAHVDSGLRSSGIFIADLSWSAATGNSIDGAAVFRLSRGLLKEVSALPGVQTAALTDVLPVREGGADGDFEIEGTPLPADPHQDPNAYYRQATSQYFKTFGIPILNGRAFDGTDDQSQEQVAIVNQAFAAKFFPGGDTIGKRIRFFGFDRKPQFMTIVGIVPDVRAFGLDKPARAEVFADLMQHAGTSLDATLVVRGPITEEAAVKSIIASLNRDTPVEFQSMDEVIAGTIARERFQTALLSLFAGFALLLSAVGIYGLLSYTVTRRTSELGIRMTLGAGRGTVLWLVLSQGGRLVAAGLTLGLLGAFLLSRTLASLLYGVKTTDPGSFVTVALVFGMVAMLGCYLPARRASKIDPNVALRYE